MIITYIGFGVLMLSMLAFGAIMIYAASDSPKISKKLRAKTKEN